MRFRTSSGLWLAIAAELVYNRGVVRPPAPMSDDTYLEHVWVNIPKREVKIMDDEGRDETVQWKFDDEGAEGFTETVSHFRDFIPEEMITYLPHR